jgi:membrane-bound lytic murein transglycosylase D
MNRAYLILLLLGVTCSISSGQIISDDDILLIQDSLIYPVYNYEYIPDVSYSEIEEKIAGIQKDVPLNFNNRVKGFVDYFTITDRDYTKEVFGRMHLYFPIIEKKLAEYGLPDELKYLSIVESGLNPRAKSRAGAIGLWQFMYGTARVYNLHIDWYIDERMDPERSTDAACRYLSNLYNEFNDWELALAAYNAGPGNVRKAIRRSGYKKKFWDIYRYLPRETRAYLPQYVALTYVANFAESHNFSIEEYNQYLPVSDTLIVNQFVYLKTLADLTGKCPDDIECLNPVLKRRAIPESARNFVLFIPYDIKELINQNRQAILDSARKTGREEMEYIARNEIGSTYGREKIIHFVRSGEVLGTLAKKYKVRVADIRSWNDLAGNIIRVNQKLNIWVTAQYYDSGTKIPVVKATPKHQVVPPGNYHIVQPGDSLWKISQQYEGLTIDALKKLNNLGSNKIIPGQRLKIG